MNEPSKTATAPAAKTSTKLAADEGLHKLRVGDVFKDAKGVEKVVWFLNESRACVVPLTSPIQHRTDDGGVIRFIAGKDSENISPDSLVEVTRSLGRKGLADLIDNRSKQSAEENMKSKTTKKPAKGAKQEGTGTPGIRAGSLGTFKDTGYSIASVVRKLASESGGSWTTPEIRAMFEKEGVECSDQTIKLNVYRGVRPKYHKDFVLAPLTKDQIPAKPKIAEKAPAAKPAAKKPAAKPAAAKPSAKPAAKPAPAKPAAKTGTAKAAPAPAKAPAPNPAAQIAALKAAKAAKAKTAPAAAK
jgi:hypothetical protein